MELAAAFSTLDHKALDIIYTQLPFLPLLLQKRVSNKGADDVSSMSLHGRHVALAHALLLVHELIITSKETAIVARYSDRSTADGPVGNSHAGNVENNNTSNETPALLHTDQTVIGLPLQQKPSPALPVLSVDVESANFPVVDPEFSVPPTINPYNPTKDYLPTWLKRTYMYWRWTLKSPLHDIPPRYAVWITLHLTHPAIKYHLHSLIPLATATTAKFASSVEVNEYILHRATGHIRVQEELAREEFCRLRQPDTMSIIAFNAQFLRIFAKIRHFYHPDRIAIQYYDRIRPAIRKRLAVKFYEKYTTTTSSGVFVTPLRDPCPCKTSKRKNSSNDNNINPGLAATAAAGSTKRERQSCCYPTLESLMLTAEQVDDFHRPLPPVPLPPKKKAGFLGTLLKPGGSDNQRRCSGIKSRQLLRVVDIYGESNDSDEYKTKPEDWQLTN